MSAIFGAISFGTKNLAEHDLDVLRQGFSECKIDRWEERKTDKVYMACGIQYFTKEAESEILPIVEEEKYFTADVVLDNREELLDKVKKFGFDSDLPDGTILYEVFKRYGEDSLNEILGAYTAVYYDESAGEAKVFGDIGGNRFIYYFWKDQVFYFSSLLTPLIKIYGEPRINKGYVADFIGEAAITCPRNDEETFVENIYRIPVALVMTVTKDGIKKRVYWDPLDEREKLKFKNYKECGKAFVSLYRKCVYSMMRSPSKTGIMLSGGYDSTSVSVFASEKLKESGEKLYSYTWVPLKEAKFDRLLKRFKLVDETEQVKKTAEFLGNVECNFMELRDMDIWGERDKVKKLFDGPYKSLQNPLWFLHCFEKASSDGVKLMLTGEFGNSSVSCDNSDSYLIYLAKRFKFIKLIREINLLHKRHPLYSRKKMFKNTFNFVLKKKIMQGDEGISYEDLYGKETVLRYRTLDPDEFGRDLMEKSLGDPEYFVKIGGKRLVLKMVSEIDQKLSLYTGVLTRDPTRDKRIIEFVMRLTPDCFTHDGYIKALICDFMRDIFPKHIFTEDRKGLQSGDMIKRLEPYNKRITDDIKKCCKGNKDSIWINTDKILEDLKDEDICDKDKDVINYMLRSCILLECMNEFKLQQN